MIDSQLTAGTALEQLTFLIGKGSTVKRVSESPLTSSGLYYCFVEVMEPGGSYYVLHAYGHEATVLYQRATEMIVKSER